MYYKCIHSIIKINSWNINRYVYKQQYFYRCLMYLERKQFCHIWLFKEKSKFKQTNLIYGSDYFETFANYYAQP